MFKTFLIFIIAVQTLAQDMLPLSQCLGNCLSCVFGELATCSNNNSITCEEGFYFSVNKSACLINPNFNSSYSTQQLLQQNNKNSLLAPIGWTQSASTQCLYIDDNGDQQFFNSLGPFKQILSTNKYFDVSPLHSVYLLSFNLIRNQWLPFNDFLVVDVQNKKTLLGSYEISFDQTPNAVSQVSIFCGGKTVITQKFSIKIINKNPTLQIKITFTGFLFNSFWGLTNVKLTSGCNQFSVFNDATKTCDKCDKGYFSMNNTDKLASCVKCPYQCMTCSALNICSLCISGYVYSNVTKSCGRDQGINQLPLVSSFLNSTRITCVGGNFSYYSLPFNNSLTSESYSSQNGANFGNISVSFQLYYNPLDWINSTNSIQIYANKILVVNLTKNNLTNKGAIQCSGKNSSISMIKFSISNPYQFNTTNIILTFNMSGNQNISYGFDNMQVFSTPNYNNVKLYTRQQLIKMMNGMQLNTPQSTNIQATANTVSNASISASININTLITNKNQSISTVIPATVAPKTQNISSNSTAIVVQNDTSTTLNPTLLSQNKTQDTTLLVQAPQKVVSFENSVQNQSVNSAQPTATMQNISNLTIKTQNQTAPIIYMSNPSIKPAQVDNSTLKSENANLSSSVPQSKEQNVQAPKQSLINSSIVTTYAKSAQSTIYGYFTNNTTSEQNSSANISTPSDLAPNSLNNSILHSNAGQSQVIKIVIIENSVSDKIAKTQNNQTTIAQQLANLSNSSKVQPQIQIKTVQNSTLSTNQTKNSSTIQAHSNVTQQKLQIPNNTIKVQYVQFAKNGTSGLKIKISNASLYTGYYLYASVSKLFNTSKTYSNPLINSQIVDDNYIGFLQVQQSFLESSIKIFGVSEQNTNVNTSRLLQQQINLEFSNIAQLKVDRYDTVGSFSQQNTQNLATSLQFFAWLAIISVILLTFIGKSVIFEDFVVSLQILFLNVYIFTNSLPNSILNSFSGLQRLQKMNYFETNSLKWLQNLFVGDLKQDSPIQFTIFDVDVNFTRSVLPILVLNLIFLVWFFVLFFYQKYTKQSEQDLIDNQPSGISKIIQTITNRKMNFVDQIWKYEFIPVAWACLKQFHNFQYPQNHQNGQIFNTLFCLMAFIAILIWPAIILVYTRSVYYERQYIEYFESFKEVFYQRVPQNHLPSVHQRVIYPVFRTAKLLIYVCLLAIFLDYPLVTLIMMSLIASFEIFYIYFYEIYQNKYCLLFKCIQCSIHVFLWAFLILIYSLSSSISTNSYLALGYTFVAFSFLIIVNGGAQSAYLGWKQFGHYFRVKQQQEEAVNIQNQQFIPKSYRVV